MSEQSTLTPNSAPAVPAQRPVIERLPVPDNRGPNQHDGMPQPLGDGQNAIHNYFLRNLNDEREGRYRPGETSADPVVTPDRGQPLAPQQRSGDIPAQQGQPPGTGAQSQPPAEQTGQPPLQAPEFDPTQTQPAGEQPGAQYGEAVLEVDGARITADNVRELMRAQQDAQHLQADYTRKTQMLSRVRQEAEALGTELTEQQQALTRKADLIMQVVDANLRAMEQTDVSKLPQEQYTQFQQQYDAAKRGKQALVEAFNKADAEAAQHGEVAFKRQSSSTAQLLRFHEPRWDKEGQFYGQLREFAVNEGLLKPEQFDRENDFLRILGLISMMDRHNLPATITETLEEPKPPERGHELPTRDSQGRFQTNVAGTTNAVLQSQNARMDGSAHAMFMARLEQERRDGTPPQPAIITR